MVDKEGREEAGRGKKKGGREGVGDGRRVLTAENVLI